MKIAYIGLRGVPASYSGIEKSVEEIGSRLAKSGNEVVIYCMKNKYTKKLNSYKGLRLKYVFSIPGKNTEMISYAFFSTLRACFSNANILHFHAIGPASFSIIARLFFKKVVVTNHGLDWKRSKWGFFAKLYLKFGEAISAKIPNSTIVVSKYIKDYYYKKYKSNVTYIPNGKDDIKDIKISSKLLENFKLKPYQYILYVGRITPEKCINDLCKAFSNISDTKFKLVIVGESIDDYQKKLQNEFKDIRIIFTGSIYDRNLLAGLYNFSNLFVLPSKIEGQSIVILEALSYGCRVLASNIPENKELLQEFGQYFNVGDRFDLQCKLYNLILTSKEDLRQNKKLKEYLEIHNWDKIAKQTELVYKKIFYNKDLLQ